MKQLFESYFPHPPEYFNSLWENALVVPDANILLDLYRYSDQTRDELIAAFEKIKDRIWVPWQAAQEFAQNRPNVISTQINMYEKARKIIENLKDSASDQIRKSLDFRVHPFLDKEEFLKEIEESLNHLEEKINEYEKQHPDLLKEDPLLTKIVGMFEGKIGEKYDPDKLEKIYKEGKDRYEKEIPPGYSDSVGPNKKQGNAIYGDLVLWNQIIEKASESKKPIIFISNDMKIDWWWKPKGRTLGCRPELKAEIKEKASVDFHMYTAERFSELAKEKLKVEIKPESINEIKSLRVKDEELRKTINYNFANDILKNISRFEEEYSKNINKISESLSSKNLLKTMWENNSLLDSSFKNISNIELLKSIQEKIKEDESLRNEIIRNWESSKNKYRTNLIEENNDSEDETDEKNDED